MRSGAHVDPLTRQFLAFRSTGRISWHPKGDGVYNSTGDVVFT